MEKLGLDLDDGSSPADAKQANPQVKIYFYQKTWLFIAYGYL